MQRVSLIRNTFYAYLIQLSGLLIPLITAPIVSRVLGASLLGKVAYTNAIATWFSTIAAFGTATYGFREVARCRGDKESLSRFFSEMMVIKAGFTLLLVIIYIPFSFALSRSYGDLTLILIQGLLLVFNLFSIDWLFQGIEDYRYITVRTLAIKLASLAAIILFVRDRQDYIVFAGISVLAIGLSNLANILYARRIVEFRLAGLSLKSRIRPLLVFFSSSIVISIYGLLDQIFLGSIRDAKDVAFFARAKMILSVCMALSGTVVNVFTARLTNYLTQGYQKYTPMLEKSRNVVFLISLPIAAGTFLLSKEIMVLLGGTEFAEATIALQILSVLCVIVPLGSWNYSQRLLPLNYEKFGLIAQLAMAGVSIVANVVLVPRLGFVGAAIAYVLAETCGTAMGLLFVRRKDLIRFGNTSVYKSMIAVSAMGIVILILRSTFGDGGIGLMIEVVVGAVVYAVVLMALREMVVFELLAKAGLKKKDT